MQPADDADRDRHDRARRSTTSIARIEELVRVARAVGVSRTATSPGGRSRLWLGAARARRSTPRLGLRRRARARARGGCVLAINHFAWIDIAARRRAVAAQRSTTSPRSSSPRARSRPLHRLARDRSRCGAASPTATRSGGCASTRATGRAIGLFVEGTRQRTRRPGHVPARRGDGRDPGGRSGRSGRDLRHAVLAARQLRTLLARLRRAVPLRRLPRRAARATRRRAPRSSAGSRPLRLARRRARSRPAGRVPPL